MDIKNTHRQASIAACSAPLPQAIAACALRVQHGAPTIRIIPAGKFDAPKGALSGAGPWNLTPTAAARIIKLNASRSADIAVDYEHQTLLSEKNGLPAPASGWIDPRSLTYITDGAEPGLYGNVKWTAAASAAIQADEYRYLSPVFPYDEATGEPLDLLHVALTNNPAINDTLTAALSARGLNHGAPLMNELLKKLLEALGLPAETTEEAALAELAKIKAKAEESTAAVASLRAATPDLSKFVPMQVMQDMQTEVAALKSQMTQTEASQLIEQAMLDGKLMEVQRSWATDLGKTNLAALKSYIETAPAIAALRGTQSGGQSQADMASGLSEADLAVCKQLGLSADEFKANKLGA